MWQTIKRKWFAEWTQTALNHTLSCTADIMKIGFQISKQIIVAGGQVIIVCRVILLHMARVTNSLPGYVLLMIYKMWIFFSLIHQFSLLIVHPSYVITALDDDDDDGDDDELPRDNWPSVSSDPATASSHECPAPSSDFIPSQTSCCASDALSTRQSNAFSWESMATLASCTSRVALTGDAAAWGVMLDDGQTSALPATVDFTDVLHDWASTDRDLNSNKSLL